MPKFILTAEHCRSAEFPALRAYCKANDIEVRTQRHPVFTSETLFHITCATKRGANKVQAFIWTEVNSGAACSIEQVEQGQ